MTGSSLLMNLIKSSMSHQRWDITGLWNCILALFSALKGTAFNLINIVLKEGSLIDRNIIVPFFYPCAVSETCLQRAWSYPVRQCFMDVKYKARVSIRIQDLDDLIWGQYYWVREWVTEWVSQWGKDELWKWHLKNIFIILVNAFSRCSDMGLSCTW